MNLREEISNNKWIYTSLFLFAIIVCLIWFACVSHNKTFSLNTENDISNREASHSIGHTIKEQQYLVDYYSNRYEVAMKIIESYRRNP